MTTKAVPKKEKTTYVGSVEDKLMGYKLAREIASDVFCLGTALPSIQLIQAVYTHCVAKHMAEDARARLLEAKKFAAEAFEDQSVDAVLVALDIMYGT